MNVLMGVVLFRCWFFVVNRPSLTSFYSVEVLSRKVLVSYTLCVWSGDGVKTEDPIHVFVDYLP